MWRRPFPAAAMLANTPFLFPPQTVSSTEKKIEGPSSAIGRAQSC